MKEKLKLISFELTDIYRAIAILCVIGCHVGNHFTRILTPIGGIGAAVFLAMSGYGLTVSYQKNGLQEYWWKRIISVWIPYMIIQGITFPIHVGTWKEVLGDITLLQTQFALGWYLEYLFLWYVIFYLVNLLKISEKYKLHIFMVIAIILAIYFNFTSSIKFEQSFSFLTGIFIAQKNWDCKKYINKKNGLGALGIATIVLAIKQLEFIRQSSKFVLNIIDLCIKWFGMVGVLIVIYIVFSWIKEKQNYSMKGLVFIGTISYELYLVHGYALEIFETSYSKPICAIIFLCVSIIGAIFMWKLDEFVSRWLKKCLLSTK